MNISLTLRKNKNTNKPFYLICKYASQLNLRQNRFVAMNNTTYPAPEEKDFRALSTGRIVIIPTMILIDVFIILINVFMIIVITRAAKLRSSLSPLFVVNLCIFNLLAGGTILPKSIAFFIAKTWPWDHNTCIANGFLNTFLCFASIFAICVITMDKYYCILFPMQHAANMTFYKTAFLIILTWALAVVFATLPILGWNNYEFNKYSGCCWAGLRRNAKTQALMMFNLAVAFLLPATLIAIVNVKLYKVAKQAVTQVQPTNLTTLPESGPSQRHGIAGTTVCRISTISFGPGHCTTDPPKRVPDAPMADHRISVIVRPFSEAHIDTRNTKVSVVHSVPTAVKQETSAMLREKFTRESLSNAKAFKTLIVSFASFSILWGPYFAVQAYRVMNESKEGRHIIEPIVIWLSYLSYAVNPLVYGCLNSNIRNECRSILLRICCKKEEEENGVVRISQTNASNEDFFQFLERTRSLKDENFK